MYFLSGDTGITADRVCSLFVLSKNWNSSEVTWNNATKTEKWEQLDLDAKYYDDVVGDTVSYIGGGDHFYPCIATSPLATINHPWESYTVTDALKKYILNPSNFYGLYLKPYLENSGRRYASSEYTEFDKRPKLTIKYSGTGIISKQVLADKTNNIILFNAQNSVRLYIPISGKYTGTVFDLKGRELCSFNGIDKKWSDIQKDKLENGINILKVTSKDLTITKKFMAY